MVKFIIVYFPYCVCVIHLNWFHKFGLALYMIPSSRPYKFSLCSLMSLQVIREYPENDVARHPGFDQLLVDIGCILCHSKKEIIKIIKIIFNCDNPSVFS